MIFDSCRAHLIKNIMKNTILRILIGAILFSLISGMIVSIFGLILGWNTSLQFSNGFFWAGGILLAIGFLSAVGMRNQIGKARLQQSQLVVNDKDEGFGLWVRVILRGNNILFFLGISGLLLFGLSSLAILAGSLFPPAR